MCLCVNDVKVTNRAAIDWLRRHLAPHGIRVHELNFTDPTSMHIDCTMMPIRPGLAVQNSNYDLKEKSLFEQGGWDIIKSPQPLVPQGLHIFYQTDRFANVFRH